MKTVPRCVVLVSVLLASAVGVAQPVHHFDFDSTSGLLAPDRTGCGGGTLLGFDNADDTHWVAGQRNGGLDLGVDGILDNRVAVNLAEVGAVSGYTVCLWINPGEQIANLGEYQLLSTPGDVVGFTLMNFDDGTVRHDRVLLFWDGNLRDLHVGTTALEPGTWYHVAITSGGVGGEKLYYIDGVAEEQALFLPAQGGTQGTHPGNVPGWPAGVGAIGAIGAGARGHDSIIDDFRVYDRVLSAAELTQVLNENPPLVPQIANLSPRDGESGHAAANGLTFDAIALAGGTTIPTAGIKLFLNDVDVSANLSIGGSPTIREVLYNQLVTETVYQARIEVVDSAGTTTCLRFTFGTLQAGGGDLVHYFRLNETAGATAIDSAGVMIGQLLGFEANDDSQWVRGVCENGLLLGADASNNNRIGFTTSAVDATELGGFTVAMWINPGAQILTPGEYQLLATPGDVVGFTLMNFNGEKRHDRVLLFWDGNLRDLHVGTTALEPGTWYHVAITSTGPGGEKLYYINGALEPQTLFLPSQGGTDGVHPGNVSGWAAGGAILGAIGGNGDRAHNSILDDVRIYKRALDESEIADAMQECNPVICKPLLLADISPQDGNSFHQAALGIELEVSTENPGFTIQPSGIQLTVNGVDVSASLVIGGTPTARVITYNGLQPSTAYDARIAVTDECTTLRRDIRFGTFLACENPEPDLVHHWRFDETQGLAALDCAGGSLGSLRGFGTDNAQWTAGVVDGGLSFGADPILNNAVETTVAGVSALENGGFTIATWINPGERIRTLGEYQIFVSPTLVVGFTIMNENGELRHDRVLLFWDGNLPNLHVGTTTLEPGTWYHVAITSTGAGGEKQYYVNGKLEPQRLLRPSQGGTEGFHPGNVDGWPAGTARIGAFFGLQGRFHGSTYDEFRIYDRALGAEEIATLAGSIVEPKDVFHRGDADGNALLQLTDAIRILGFLFLGQPAPTCLDAADADDNGLLQLTDAVRVLGFLFLGQAPPAPPGPPGSDCGVDPAEPADELDCALYESCQ